MEKLIKWGLVFFGLFVAQTFAAESSFVPIKVRSSSDSDSIGSSPRFRVFSPKKGVIEITEINYPAEGALPLVEEKHIPTVPKRLSPTDKDYDVQLDYDRSLFKSHPERVEVSSLSGRVIIFSFLEGERDSRYPERNVIIWQDRKGKTIAVKLPTDEDPSYLDLGNDPEWVYYARLGQIEKGRVKKARLFLGNKKTNKLRKRHSSK